MSQIEFNMGETQIVGATQLSRYRHWYSVRRDVLNSHPIIDEWDSLSKVLVECLEKCPVESDL